MVGQIATERHPFDINATKSIWTWKHILDVCGINCMKGHCLELSCVQARRTQGQIVFGVACFDPHIPTYSMKFTILYSVTGYSFRFLLNQLVRQSVVYPLHLCCWFSTSAESFSAGSPVFLPPIKPTLLDSNSIWKQRTKSLSVGWANAYLFTLFIYWFIIYRNSTRTTLKRTSFVELHGKHLWLNIKEKYARGNVNFPYWLQ